MIWGEVMMGRGFKGFGGKQCSGTSETGQPNERVWRGQ